LAGPSSKPRSTRTGVPGSQPVEAPRTPIDDHLDKIADFAKEMGGGIEALRQALMRDFEGPIRIGGKYLDWLLIAMPLPRVDRVIREGNYWHLIPGATQLIDAWRTVKHTLFDAAPDAADYEKMLQGSKDPSNAKARGWLMAITHRAPGSSFVWRLAEVTFNFESGANEYGRKLKPVERIERAMDIVAEGATMIIAGLGGKGRKQGKAAAASEEGELSAPKVLRSPRYGNYVRRVDDFKHALSPEHVKTALLEKEGTTVKINPKTGRPYDHLGETRRAMHGAFDRIALLKKYLSDPELSTELRTAVQSELGELSNMLDNAERILGESAR
jgi:hypothetical protein